jgi:hypothetical protein
LYEVMATCWLCNKKYGVVNVHFGQCAGGYGN